MPRPPLTSPPAPSAAAVRALATGGVLRAGINLSNFLLVTGTGDGGEPVGVSPSMAKGLADALGVQVELVSFGRPGEVVEALVSGHLDVGNVGADPDRALVDFTAPYCEIEATYLVRGDSPIGTAGQVDRPGVRIASARGAAYTLWLDRNITDGQLVHTDTVDESLEVFVSKGLEVLAGLRPWLLDVTATMQGSRLLDGRFMSVQQAIGTPAGRGPAAVSYLERYVAWSITSGAVASLVSAHGVRGLSVATVAGS